MNKVKKFFLEYEKNFETGDVLKDNEKRANIFTSIAMIILYIVILIVGALLYAGVINFGIISALDDSWNKMFKMLMIIGVFTLFIPAVIGLIVKGDKKWLKWFLMIFLIISLAMATGSISYSIVLMMMLPVILSTRYNYKNFTIFVTLVTFIAYIVALCVGRFYLAKDIMNIDFEFSPGYYEKNSNEFSNETEEIKLDLSELNNKFQNSSAIVENDNEENKVEFLETVKQTIPENMPNIIIYIIASLICIQVTKHGKRMIEKQKKLSEDKARTESELNIASQIQKNILPSKFPAFPERTEFDIYASMTPAKEVGGDFYDMFLIDENHLAILIADVSGKGVPASLIMMTAKSLIKNTALNGNSVENVFNIVNRFLCDGNTSNHFITTWFGILDLKTGVIEYTNAGHNPPVIYSKKEDKYSYLKSNPNLILGIMDDTKYEKNKVTLAIGDKIFLYTDGVTEATSDKDELYGEKRLLDYLNNHKEESVTDTIKGVKQDIDSFIGTAEQFDDITMLELLLKEIKEG